MMNTSQRKYAILLLVETANFEKKKSVYKT